MIRISRIVAGCTLALIVSSAPAWRGPDDAATASEPYPLDSCIISGQKLGSKGDPVVKTYEGREVRFCCGGCVGRFEVDTTGNLAKIDARIIADQLRYYPTVKCVVTGEPLIEDGEDIATNVVYGNRLVRLCCRACTRDFNADPATYLAKLDEAVKETQRADYPLDTCIVAGGKLGSMGDPYEVVMANRLFRFCCGGCAPQLTAEPVKYMAKIDEAWQAKGRFAPATDKATTSGADDASR